MSLNSITFLFWFLPVFFILYYLMPRAARPWALLVFSYAFYAWGSLQNLYLLLAVTAGNYLLGLLVSKSRWCFLSAVGIDLLLLAVFKYFDTGMGLPLGISFYTFHAISYLSDVYHERSEAAKNPLDLALYLALFTKLTMGPIVSYSELAPQLRRPKISLSDIEAGIVRFCVGFAKKAALAGSLAALTETAWADAPNSTLSAWLGIVSFTLQLYFDFSGYSDMAIGLSQMIGLQLGENFRHPYLSCSVSEFWRRWHISLGAWFRQYLYIPLGGNRGRKLSVYRNLAIVWLATGIWHGSGWNFVLWGLWHGLFVCLERAIDAQKHIPKLIGWLYTFPAVLLGWVLFYSEDLGAALSYIDAMFGGAVNLDLTVSQMLLHDNRLLLILAAVFATSLPAAIGRRLFDGLHPAVITLARIALIALCIYLSVTCILVSGYTPFIYTEF